MQCWCKNGRHRTTKHFVLGLPGYFIATQPKRLQCYQLLLSDGSSFKSVGPQQRAIPTSGPHSMLETQEVFLQRRSCEHGHAAGIAEPETP